MESKKVNKAWKIKLFFILAIATTLSLGVYMYQGSNVTLFLEEEVTQITSYASTVGEFLEKENIPFKEGGYINVALDQKLEENMDIIIKNPKSYNISIGGSIGDVTSVYTTVDEVLTDLGIELGVNDYTSPTKDTKIGTGSTIEIFKVVEVVETVEGEIPFEKIVNKNNKLERGKSNVVQKGEEGLKVTEVKKEYVNGQLNSKVVIKEEIVKEPISEIIEQGTKEKVKITPSRGATSYREVVQMSATAYDLSYASTGKRPGDKYYGITASGTKARPGVVAVDPRVIPLGTRLYIESTDGTPDYGFATAEDKGGAIKGNKIDLFFESASQVKQFGRRKVKVYILGK